ncbi:hypothetical protein VTN00DRAFT_5686 [Thermoascus crustaceus]|uniref:uncharacterized protein n=1 Tax=Thermoascus crustaceus TaxID=5088 RepID=UPI0037441505
MCGRLLPPLTSTSSTVVFLCNVTQAGPAQRFFISSIPGPPRKGSNSEKDQPEYGAGSRSMRITIRYPTFSPPFGGKHVTQNVLLTRPQRREQRPLDRGSPSSLPNRIRTVTPIQAYELSFSRSSLRNLEIGGTEMRKPPGVSPFVLSANPGHRQSRYRTVPVFDMSR